MSSNVLQLISIGVIAGLPPAPEGWKTNDWMPELAVIMTSKIGSVTLEHYSQFQAICCTLRRWNGLRIIKEKILFSELGLNEDRCKEIGAIAAEKFGTLFERMDKMAEA